MDKAGTQVSMHHSVPTDLTTMFVHKSLGPMAEHGKPLNCIGIPMQAVVGHHDFVQLTPDEVKEKGMLWDDNGYPWRAHLGDKFIHPNDWTRAKFDVCLPVYTDLEAKLLLSLRQVRGLLVQNMEDARKLTEHTSDVVLALSKIDSILKLHEARSQE